MATKLSFSKYWLAKLFLGLYSGPALAQKESRVGETPKSSTSVLEQKIVEVALSNRAKRLLAKKGIVTVRDLVLWKESFRGEGLGEKTFEEITGFLSEHNLMLGMKENQLPE